MEVSQSSLIPAIHHGDIRQGAVVIGRVAVLG
jgi:hypothetical protein